MGVNMCSILLQVFILSVAAFSAIEGRIAFEKLTGMDFRGSTYYTIRNLTLYECQSWCREEPACKAAAFSFVTNPLAPIQETVCLLQNETQADNPAASPQRAVSLYYFVKIQIRTDVVCTRPWQFERVPNKILRSLDTAQVFTSTKEACLTACLNEERFTCRSAEYNYATLQCHLSEYDQRSPGVNAQLLDAQGVDYFENLCLKSDDACGLSKDYEVPKVGIKTDQVAQYVDINFWVDREVMANSRLACQRACELEQDFLCRAYLYKEGPDAGQYNCRLYHVDHYNFPDGAATFAASAPFPLIDSGQEAGTYYELACLNKPKTTTSVPTTVAAETSTITADSKTAPANTNCDSFGVCYDVSVSCKNTKIIVNVKTNKPFNGRLYALGRAETCNFNVRQKADFSLDLSLSGQDCNTQNVGGAFTNTIVVQHHSMVITKTDKLFKIRCMYDITSRNITYDMMSVGDPITINVTAAPEAPLPHIVILGRDGREAGAVRIGDQLTFRIEIPGDTPYGIFARSCIAMAKDSRSTFQIVDDRGCPVDPDIFPHFEQDGNALQTSYEAFRFTESYGVIFQCNVKYCLGPCESIECSGNGRKSLEAFGRRKRSDTYAGRSSHRQPRMDDKDMTLSQEILVLDQEDDAVDPARPSGTTGSFDVKEDIRLTEECSSKSTVMALGVVCALLSAGYISSLTVLLVRRWIIRREKDRIIQ